MDDVVCHSLKSEAKNPPVAGTGSELVDFGSSSSPSISASSGLSTTPHRDPTPFTAKINAELNLKFIFLNEENETRMLALSKLTIPARSRPIFIKRHPFL